LADEFTFDLRKARHGTKRHKCFLRYLIRDLTRLRRLQFRLKVGELQLVQAPVGA
jgi:hypothetical protein